MLRCWNMKKSPNFLVDGLPKTLTVSGETYSIYTDFRTSIRFELMQEEGDENFVMDGLALYFGRHVPPDLQAAIEAVNWFRRCGKPDKRIPASARGNGKQAFSFSQDAECVYAAFLEQYGIDLLEVEYMHWWKFRALFDSLSNSSRLTEIMGYRVARLEKLPKEQRQFYQDMQRYYEIRPREADEKMKLLDEILKRGGDPSEVLKD